MTYTKILGYRLTPNEVKLLMMIYRGEEGEVYLTPGYIVRLSELRNMGLVSRERMELTEEGIDLAWELLAQDAYNKQG